jgi:hypothetical protein
VFVTFWVSLEQKHHCDLDRLFNANTSSASRGRPVKSGLPGPKSVVIDLTGFPISGQNRAQGTAQTKSHFVDLTMSENERENGADGTSKRLPYPVTLGDNEVEATASPAPRLANQNIQRKSQGFISQTTPTVEALRLPVSLPNSTQDPSTEEIVVHSPQMSNSIRVARPSSTATEMPAISKSKATFRPPVALSTPTHGDEQRQPELSSQFSQNNHSPAKEVPAQALPKNTLLDKKPLAKTWRTTSPTARTEVAQEPAAAQLHFKAPSVPVLNGSGKRNRDESPRDSPSKKQKIQIPASNSQAPAVRSNERSSSLPGSKTSQIDPPPIASFNASNPEKGRATLSSDKPPKAAQKQSVDPAASSIHPPLPESTSLFSESSSSTRPFATGSSTQPSSLRMNGEPFRKERSLNQAKASSISVSAHTSEVQKVSTTTKIETAEGERSALPDRSILAPHSPAIGQTSNQPLPSRAKASRKMVSPPTHHPQGEPQVPSTVYTQREPQFTKGGSIVENKRNEKSRKHYNTIYH